jgi:uncharacterized membrane protein (DUF373 family)
MNELLKATPSPNYNWLNSGRMIRILESIQDLIVVSLCLGLFSFMLIQLREMVLSLLPPLDFPSVTSDILFLLILVELFRLLVIYLQEHRVSVGVAVEVSIFSVLREIIVRGILEIPWTQVLATCSFLLVLGVLLIVRGWIPPTFEGIDPEQRISRRRQQQVHSAPTETVNSEHHAVEKSSFPLLTNLDRFSQGNSTKELFNSSSED